MKILHVVSYYPPDKIGGVGQVVRYLHAGLKRKGTQSMVVTTGKTRSKKDVLRSNTPPALFFLFVLRHFKKAWKADIVHFQGGDGLLLLAMLTILSRNKPTVVTFHAHNRHLAKAEAGQFSDNGCVGLWRKATIHAFKRGLYRLADYLSFLLAKQVIFISKSVQRDFLGCEKHVKCVVIYNGLPDLPCQKMQTGYESPPTILYVGNESNRKRFRVLPDLFLKVREQVPNAKLIVAGVRPDVFHGLLGEFRDDLSRNVQCVGMLNSNEIHELYGLASAVIIPSCYEGLPMVLLEACRAGVPVVATDVSGHPEVIVDNINGYLAPKDDIDELARKLVLLLSDLAHSSRMGGQARKAFENGFLLERHLDQHLELYSNLLGG